MTSFGDSSLLQGIRFFLATVLLACLGLAGSFALAQPRFDGVRDLGRAEFEANCAHCHGMQGRGDGPLRGFLTRPTPDLTVLARENGGVFPVSRIYEVILGTEEPTVHGTREMPVWGREYRRRAAEHYFDAPYDPEVFVRARILALIDYIARLQQRAP